MISFITSFVECDSGDFPVNGLSLHFSSSSANGTLALTGTVSNDTVPLDFSVLPTGYITVALDVSDNDAVRSIVTCFDNPPLQVDLNTFTLFLFFYFNNKENYF